MIAIMTDVPFVNSETSGAPSRPKAGSPYHPVVRVDWGHRRAGDLFFNTLFGYVKTHPFALLVKLYNPYLSSDCGNLIRRPL